MLLINIHMYYICKLCIYVYIFFFFFQAEDGIRDWSVTGVQTCALPISRTCCASYRWERNWCWPTTVTLLPNKRSEERRVGKECRSRWLLYHYKKNIIYYRTVIRDDLYTSNSLLINTRWSITYNNTISHS